MTDAITKQSEHLRIVLAECKSYDEFCEAINVYRSGSSRQFSKTNIQNWLYGGKEMSKRRAEEIHAAFPQYSVDWLRGYSDYKNEEEERKAELEELLEHVSTKLDCVERLIELTGVRVEYGNDYYREMSKGGKSAYLAPDQYNCFIDEVGDYIEMRLNQILERGHW